MTSVQEPGNTAQQPLNENFGAKSLAESLICAALRHHRPALTLSSGLEQHFGVAAAISVRANLGPLTNDLELEVPTESVEKVREFDFSKGALALGSLVASLVSTAPQNPGQLRSFDRWRPRDAFELAVFEALREPVGNS